MSTAGWLEAVGLQAVWSLVPLNCSLTTIALTTVLALAMLAGGWPWVFGLAVVELLVGVWLFGFLDDSRPADELVADVPVLLSVALWWGITSWFGLNPCALALPPKRGMRLSSGFVGLSCCMFRGSTDALATGDDHVHLFWGPTFQLNQQIGLFVRAASLATLVVDAQLASRRRVRGARDRIQEQDDRQA